jgi:hypothetical protein
MKFAMTTLRRCCWRYLCMLPWGSEGILMDQEGSRALVFVSGANKVAVMDLKSLSGVGPRDPAESF